MTDDHTVSILVVDDDPKVRLLLRRCFEDEGYRVSEVARGMDVVPAIERSEFDLVTLDLTLPDTDGLTVARAIRERSRVPIIMVTGKGDMIDRIIGLEIGADDYIAKPFHLREVLARVRAVLRRAAQASAPVAPAAASSPPERLVALTFEGWTALIERREVRNVDGGVCNLTTAEFGLLEIFLKHPNRVLSRDQIMDLLKGHEWSPLDRSVDNLVARLRKKIETHPDAPKLVKTVRGLGYLFAATVRQAVSDPAERP
ncbi:MAG: response regulator [Hyphomicrobiaceae bacterium]|nr:response regulator [Hyphomicrobiaceae bacterium]